MRASAECVFPVRSAAVNRNLSASSAVFCDVLRSVHVGALTCRGWSVLSGTVWCHDDDFFESGASFTTASVCVCVRSTGGGGSICASEDEWPGMLYMVCLMHMNSGMLAGVRVNLGHRLCTKFYMRLL